MSSLPVRFATSLLFDLLLPWTISAAFVAFFFTLVMTIGLWAWPACAAIFLLACNLRRDARERDALAAADAAAGLDEAALLAKYGIASGEGHYVFDGVLHASLELALGPARIAYAGRRRRAWPAPPEGAAPALPDA